MVAVIPVRQVSENCFGACVSMLTGINQMRLPTNVRHQPNSIYTFADNIAVTVCEMRSARYWRSLLRTFGWEIEYHFVEPDEPFIYRFFPLAIGESGIPVPEMGEGHAIVVDTDGKVIDPAGYLTGESIDDMIRNYCNLAWAEPITLRRATKTERLKGYIGRLIWNPRISL